MGATPLAIYIASILVWNSLQRQHKGAEKVLYAFKGGADEFPRPASSM